MSKKLFSPTRLGNLELTNHIAMAPMTRCRAIDNIPNDLMATYYRQRAGAGLIITEGTAPSANGLGYARIPGVFSNEQVAGWRKVTDAVHADQGKIFLQIMHTGRVSHPANMPAGAEVLAPSAVNVESKMYVDGQGELDMPTPRAMEITDIEQAIQEYVTAAQNAIAAGFDGVELHGANGYLIDQFLHPGPNQRTDNYGGSIENRCRFLLEVVERVTAAIGVERTGIRLSPYGVYNNIPMHDELDATYNYLAQELSGKVVYLHLVDHSTMGTPEVPLAIKQSIRNHFNGTIILSGGYNAERAEADLQSGLGDLVAFGRPFIANPDLAERLESGAELQAPDHSTFYMPGAAGYTDYPTLAASTN